MVPKNQTSLVTPFQWMCRTGYQKAKICIIISDEWVNSSFYSRLWNERVDKEQIIYVYIREQCTVLIFFTFTQSHLKIKFLVQNKSEHFKQRG